MQLQSFNVMAPIRVKKPFQILDIFSSFSMFGNIIHAVFCIWISGPMKFKFRDIQFPIGHGHVLHFLNICETGWMRWHLRCTCRNRVRTGMKRIPYFVKVLTPLHSNFCIQVGHISNFGGEDKTGFWTGSKSSLKFLFHITYDKINRTTLKYSTNFAYQLILPRCKIPIIFSPWHFLSILSVTIFVVIVHETIRFKLSFL